MIYAVLQHVSQSLKLSGAWEYFHSKDNSVENCHSSNYTIWCVCVIYIYIYSDTYIICVYVHTHIYIILPDINGKSVHINDIGKKDNEYMRANIYK